MQKTLEKRVQSLGQGDPLDEGMAAHSSVLTWKIPWSRAWQPTPVGLPGRSPGRGHGSPLQCSYLEDPLVEGTAAHSSVLTWRIPWIRERQPTPVGLPGRSLGRGHGSPLQCSYLEDPLDESTAALENPMDRGAWHATVLGVSKSQKQLK